MNQYPSKKINPVKLKKLTITIVPAQEQKDLNQLKAIIRSQSISNILKIVDAKGFKTSARASALGWHFSREISNTAHQVCMEVYQKVNEDKSLRQRLDLWDIPEESLEDIGRFVRVRKQARIQLQETGQSGTLKSLVSQSLQIQEELSHELSFSSLNKSKQSAKFTYLLIKPLIHSLALIQKLNRQSIESLNPTSKQRDEK